MFCFGLGNLALLLNESLISGFTTGATIHVLTSQLKDIFGLKLERNVGQLQLIYVSIIYYYYWVASAYQA